jgi:hypothetical protein
MNIEILIPIVIIIGCFLLIIIKNDSSDQFKSEYRESEIILPNPIPTFISNLQDKKEIIINNKDDNNNYPSIKYDLDIDPPQIDLTQPKKGEAYNDDNFIRDKGVVNAMNTKKETNKIDYNKVVDRFLDFEQPKNSSDLLTTRNFKNISKDELDNSTLADIYNSMIAKVVNNISAEQIDNITGKTLDNSNITTDLYNPVLTLIDENLNYNNIKDIEYKYNAYDKLPIGRLIK